MTLAVSRDVGVSEGMSAAATMCLSIALPSAVLLLRHGFEMVGVDARATDASEIGEMVENMTDRNRPDLQLP